MNARSSGGLPPAGWYPDPADSARLRYWSGASWTDHTAPADTAAQGEHATASASGSASSSSSASSAAGYGSYPGLDPADTESTRSMGAVSATVSTDQTLSGQRSGAVGAGPAVYSGPPILIVTTNEVPGYRVTDVHGEVFGLTVRARNLFSNIGASLRTVFGGEAKGYTDLLIASRQEAVERLKQACHQAGGNAVLAMRFDTGEIADLMNEVAAYGTAVTVEKLD